jgi:ribosome-binding factor A
MADPARARKIADRIKVIVAEYLEFRLKDERLGFVTITDARVTGDLQQASVVREDSAGMQAFYDRWRDRVEKVTNARHRIMLRVILGETLEHKRFFDQMVAGRLDLLGRAADGARTAGAVIPTRWVE